MIKAIRGAITVENNTAEAIAENTTLLLQSMMTANDLCTEQIVQAVFSATADLNAAYPAKFARMIGWEEIPLFCVQEMAVEGSLSMCLRVLLTVDTTLEKVQHIYLKGAQVLRPDLLS